MRERKEGSGSGIEQKPDESLRTFFYVSSPRLLVIIKSIVAVVPSNRGEYIGEKLRKTVGYKEGNI